MKKLILSALAICSLFFTGCKTTPSVETLNSTAYAVGVSAALVANQTKISDKDRGIIIDIMNDVNEAVPETNSTFAVSWTPIAQRHIAELIEAGKLDAAEGEVIMTVFVSASHTIDYIIFKRYPKIGNNVAFLSAVTHGFVDGFLTHFKPANILSTVKSDVVYDAEAYEYMLKQVK